MSVSDMAAAAEPAPQEQLRVTSVELLRISKGDTVVVRADATTQEQVLFVSQALGTIMQAQGLGPEDVTLLIIPSNLDIKILSPEQMKAKGWERSSRLLVPGNGILPH